MPLVYPPYVPPVPTQTPVRKGQVQSQGPRQKFTRVEKEFYGPDETDPPMDLSELPDEIPADREALVQAPGLPPEVLRQRKWAAARELEAAIEGEIPEDHPALRLLKRENRRKLLAYWASVKHTEERVVQLGEGMGWDLVEVRNDKPRFVAMEMLMKMEGDFQTGPTVNVQGERVVLMISDNGRMPTTAEPELAELGPGLPPESNPLLRP